VTGKLVLLDRFANDLFRDTIGVNIGCEDLLAIRPQCLDHIRHTSIPSCKSPVVRSLQQRQRLFLFNDPWLPFGRANAHSTQDGYRNFQATLSQTLVFGLRLLEETFNVQLVCHGCGNVTVGDLGQGGIVKTFVEEAIAVMRSMSL
jgi:hypothetical protein